jgi:hypothetical protein
MAKKALIDPNLFAKTTTAQPQASPQDDIIKAQGVGLKLSEWAELDTIAADLGMKRHALRVYAVRYFLAAYKAGKIRATTRTVKSLPGNE